MTPAPQSELARERRKVESLRAELLTVYEELSTLYSLGPQIGRLTGEDQIAAAALREAMEVLRADCGWVVLFDDGHPHIPDGCRVGIGVGAADCVIRRVVDPLYARARGHILLHTQDDECRNHPDAPARLLACSLPARGMSQGYLCLGRKESGPIFTTADQKLINAVASLTAVALENIRLQNSELERQRLEKELELARTIQDSLLPQDFACMDFLDAAGLSLPCQEIGGDYFDLFPVPGNQCLLIIADVSGKGPAAALRAAMVQGIVHAVSKHSTDLLYLMRVINDCIRLRSGNRNFVTAFLGLLDEKGDFRYANGGHDPPLCIRTSGQVMSLTEGAGPLLGILKNPEYTQGSIRLDPGDLLLLFTDGVTDSEDERGDPFGGGRILRWAATQSSQSPEAVRDSLMGAVKQFCGDRRQADDLTFLIARFRSGCM